MGYIMKDEGRKKFQIDKWGIPGYPTGSWFLSTPNVTVNFILHIVWWTEFVVKTNPCDELNTEKRSLNIRNPSLSGSWQCHHTCLRIKHTK